MLDVSAINGHVPEAMRNLINDLRRAETSSTTIVVQPRSGTYNVLEFIDSRFLQNDEINKLIAALYYTGGAFELSCPRIKNVKFRPSTPGYHKRVTQDPRKMQKFLRSHIYPFSILEIMDLTDDVGRLYDLWVDQPHSEMWNTWGRAATEHMIEEVVHLHSMGVTHFKTRMFQQLAERGLPLYHEHQRRKKLEMVHMHVFIEPDGKVVVTGKYDDLLSGGGGSGKPVMQSRTYDSLDAAPLYIRQQVSMLKLLDKGTYVPEVGKHMADNIYWVHVHHADIIDSQKP